MNQQEKHAARTMERVVERSCGKGECRAFSVTPEEGFKHGGDHSILFDHTLISAVGESFPFKFRCGNIMALSAPGKGLSEEGKATAKYMTFFRQNGEAITEKWVELVNTILSSDNNIKIKEEAKIQIPQNYKEIGSIKDNKYSRYYVELHNKIAKALPLFLKTHVFSKNRDWKKKPIQDALIQNLEGQRDNTKYRGEGRIDKAYQLLFFNDLWQTQKFGGFDAGKDGPYDVFYEGLVDKDRKMIGEAETTLQEFIIQSLDGDSEKVDVLFLCESVQHLDKILGDAYSVKSIERDTENGEIYSAIYKKNNKNIKDIIEVDVGVDNNKEFGVFEVTHKNGTSKVAVVHTIEKVEKSGKELVGPSKKEWKEFITMMQNQGVNYIVGDTNMTAKKSKLTDKGDGSKKTFWESLAKEDRTKLVNEAVVPTRKIKKVRLGDSGGSKVNGWLNNQINKGGDGNEEVDGMVILKLSEGGENVDTTQVGTAETNTGGGRRRRRRKTKKKRKSKRKRKTKKKRKSKRKRRRTKKR